MVLVILQRVTTGGSWRLLRALVKALAHEVILVHDVLFRSHTCSFGRVFTKLCLLLHYLMSWRRIALSLDAIRCIGNDSFPTSHIIVGVVEVYDRAKRLSL